MKTEIVTDLPMGILLMVISQFFLVGVHFAIISPYTWYTLLIAVICSVMYWKIFNVGFKVAFLGIEVDVEKQ
jgi:hypothetical protein